MHGFMSCMPLCYIYNVRVYCMYMYMYHFPALVLYTAAKLVKYCAAHIEPTTSEP